MLAFTPSELSKSTLCRRTFILTIFRSIGHYDKSWQDFEHSESIRINKGCRQTHPFELLRSTCTGERGGTDASIGKKCSCTIIPLRLFHFDNYLSSTPRRW